MAALQKTTKTQGFKRLYLRTLNLTEKMTTKIIRSGTYVPAWRKIAGSEELVRSVPKVI